MATTPLIRARVAVSVLFVINGFALSTWLPRLAELQADLGLSDAQLGLVLAAGAAGGLIVGPLGGYLIAHSSSARVSVWCYLLIVPALPLIGLAPNGWVLAGVLLWLGALDAVMDGAMNAHGLRVQQRYGRSVINSFHGYWSLGTVAGAVVGTRVAGRGTVNRLDAGRRGGGLGRRPRLTARWLLPGRDPVSHDADEDARAPRPRRRPTPAPSRPPATGGCSRGATALLGLFTLLAVIIEDIPARWSSIYLTDIGAPAALVGVGVHGVHDRDDGRSIRRRPARQPLHRAASSCASAWSARGVALAAALLVGTAWAYIAACVVIGLGVATLFPAAMHAATQIPGVRPAMGVATVGWLARGGFVVAPIAVGAVAERYGIAWGLTVPILAAAAARPTERDPAPAPPRANTLSHAHLHVRPARPAPRRDAGRGRLPHQRRRDPRARPRPGPGPGHR